MGNIAQNQSPHADVRALLRVTWVISGSITVFLPKASLGLTSPEQPKRQRCSYVHRHKTISCFPADAELASHRHHR